MVILIEDNLSHALYVEHLFRRRNETLLHVRTPLEGYPLALKHAVGAGAAGQPGARAIILDINLPLKHLVAGPDGLDIATLLLDDRACGRLANVPIIIISGFITAESEVYAREIGVDMVASKPISEDFADRVLSLPAPGNGGRLPRRTVENVRKTILLSHQVEERAAPQAQPAVAVTAEELRLVFKLLFPSFRFRDQAGEDKQRGEAILERLGGRRPFADHCQAFVAHLGRKNLPYRHTQARILAMIQEGYPRGAIEHTMAMGRRKLESAIEEILADFAGFLLRNL